MSTKTEGKEPSAVLGRDGDDIPVPLYRQPVRIVEDPLRRIFKAG